MPAFTKGAISVGQWGQLQGFVLRNTKKLPSEGSYVSKLFKPVRLPKEGQSRSQMDTAAFTLTDLSGKCHLELTMQSGESRGFDCGPLTAKNASGTAIQLCTLRYGDRSHQPQVYEYLHGIITGKGRAGHPWAGTTVTLHADRVEISYDQSVEGADMHALPPGQSGRKSRLPWKKQ